MFLFDPSALPSLDSMWLINILVCSTMSVFDIYILDSRTFLFDPYIMSCSRIFV